MYRDLKPENILVDERGHLKLTDFGLCKLDFGVEELTASFVGSPEYMSPEILSYQYYNYSVDFYTLGVLFYEMLVGLPPHYNQSREQMYHDRCNKPVRVPIRSEVVKDLLEGLLQINPEVRLGSSKGITEVKEHPFFKDINWESL